VADVHKQLCAVVLPATTLTALYTVPASKEAVLSTLCVCNRGNAMITLRLAHAAGGAADALGQYFAYGAEIQPHQTVPYTMGICMAAGDVLRGYASAAGLSIVGWGEESDVV
jgi:hypothetical protein